jgi:antitoxin (DNA-binding transcriptional repressor) of toxin-antitoxin stability system
VIQVTIEDAQSRLGELIASGIPGEEIGIIQGSRLVAKLVPLVSDDAPRPRFGSAKDVILYMADDFDAPLDEFKEYME